MLSVFYTALFLSFYLAVFFALSLFNITRTMKTRRGDKAKVRAEVERQGGFLLALAAFGTLFFFLVSVAYPLLAFTGFFQLIDHVPLQLRFSYDTWIQAIGILLETVGCFLFLWSVLERGRNPSVLVTWGPFRYVRHPSYLGYFLMFIGLFFLLLNVVALVPLVAIPGYVGLTTYEEQLLVTRFGNDYVEYQKRTGRFIPRIKRWTDSEFY